MGAPAKQADAKATRKLLKEGAQSYHEAVTAIIAFQEAVQEKCRKVLESNLAKYASALKVHLTKGDIENTAWPLYAKWDGNWGLGAKIFRRDIPKVRWWSLECHLEYYVGWGLYCSVAEWFPAKIAARVYDKFQSLNPKALHDDKYGVWLEAAVKIERVSHFEKPLEVLVKEWTRLWKKVGGIKALFK